MPHKVLVLKTNSEGFLQYTVLQLCCYAPGGAPSCIRARCMDILRCRIAGAPCRCARAGPVCVAATASKEKSGGAGHAAA